jgi:hypothetical protein
MKLFDILIDIYQLSLIEDTIVGALLHFLPKRAWDDLGNTFIFHAVYLNLFDLLVEDQSNLLFSEQLWDFGGEEREVYHWL